MTVAPFGLFIGGKNMTHEKVKDMSMYIYLMHMVQNCRELNEIVKDDLNEIKKIIGSNLGIEVVNVAYDAK